MPTVCQELCTVAKLHPNPGESFADFAARLTRKINELADKDEEANWKPLSKAAQDWTNDTVTKLNDIRALKKEGKLDEAAGVALPELVGFEVAPAKQDAADGPPVKAAGKKKSVPKAKATTKAAPAPKKAKGKPNGGKRGRPGAYAEDASITLLAKENPYREGSIGAKVFAKYHKGMRVAEFVKAVGALRLQRTPAEFLRFDVKSGHVKVS